MLTLQLLGREQFDSTHGFGGTLLTWRHYDTDSRNQAENDIAQGKA
jgi:hypothetical protein